MNSTGHDNQLAFTHTDASGVKMVDVGDKAASLRTARAEATVLVGPALAAAIAANEVKKGDVLGTAQLAGIAAAKRTADLIPLCHPLPLDGVRVSLSLDEEAGRVRVEAEVRTFWKTGVEMEAFTCATAAALTVIDMGKAIERDCRIEQVRLLEKTGGRRGSFRADGVPPSPPSAADGDENLAKTFMVRGADGSRKGGAFRVAVLTVSDRVAGGAQEDLGGPAVAQAIRDLLADSAGTADSADVIAAATADGRAAVAAALRELLLDAPDLVLTTGGTGLAPRDHTPEATADVLDRPAPGLMELARARCSQRFAMASLSRGIAGVAGESLVINLPGSPKGAVETLEALADVLPHALATVAGSPDATANPGHGRV